MVLYYSMMPTVLLSTYMLLLVLVDGELATTTPKSNKLGETLPVITIPSHPLSAKLGTQV